MDELKRKLNYEREEKGGQKGRYSVFLFHWTLEAHSWSRDEKEFIV